MVSEIVDRIIVAEKRAAEKSDAAVADAQEIISSANRDAVGIVDKARQEALAESESMMRANLMEIDGMTATKSKESLDEVNSLINQTTKRKAKAVDTVLSLLFRQQ